MMSLESQVTQFLDLLILYDSHLQENDDVHMFHILYVSYVWMFINKFAFIRQCVFHLYLMIQYLLLSDPNL